MTYSGASWEYDYRVLSEDFSDDHLKKYCNSTKAKFAKITKSWSEEKNTEWILKNYFSVKMILASSVMLTSLDYSMDKNLQIVQGYLAYYAILNSSRALIYSLPQLKWKEDNLAEMTHSKIINLTADSFKLLSVEESKSLVARMEFAKEIREMFSYKFPASGLKSIPNNPYEDLDLLIRDCTEVVELAQLNTECLFASLEKNVGAKFPVNDEMLSPCFNHSSKYGIFDNDDTYRISQLTKNGEGMPCHIWGTMREGLVEDFFGSWCSDNGKYGDYDPDKNWSIIFDVP